MDAKGPDMNKELLDLLYEIQMYMDDRADSVDDGSGNPTANIEMRLSYEIETMILKIEKE
jgi:hypothetical protein